MSQPENKGLVRIVDINASFAKESHPQQQPSRPKTGTRSKTSLPNADAMPRIVKTPHSNVSAAIGTEINIILTGSGHGNAKARRSVSPLPSEGTSPRDSSTGNEMYSTLKEKQIIPDFSLNISKEDPSSSRSGRRKKSSSVSGRPEKVTVRDVGEDSGDDSDELLRHFVPDTNLTKPSSPMRRSASHHPVSNGRLQPLPAPLMRSISPLGSKTDNSHQEKQEKLPSAPSVNRAPDTLRSTRGMTLTGDDEKGTTPSTQSSRETSSLLPLLKARVRPAQPESHHYATSSTTDQSRSQTASADGVDGLDTSISSSQLSLFRKLSVSSAKDVSTGSQTSISSTGTSDRRSLLTNRRTSSIETHDQGPSPNNSGRFERLSSALPIDAGSKSVNPSPGPDKGKRRKDSVDSRLFPEQSRPNLRKSPTGDMSLQQSQSHAKPVMTKDEEKIIQSMGSRRLSSAVLDILTTKRPTLPTSMAPVKSSRESLDAFLESSQEDGDIEELVSQARQMTDRAEEVRKRARYHWAVLSIVLMVFGTLGTHRYSKAAQSFWNMPIVESGDHIRNILKLTQQKPDHAFNTKVEDLLSGERSRADMEMLEKQLRIRVRSLQRFTLDQRLKFCSIMQYESYEENSIIVREGHVSYAFYFLLSGQVQIFKEKDGKRYFLNTLNSGESFGDRTMNMLNDKRTATVVTTMPSIFLRIDKSDYFDIVSVGDSRQLPYLLGHLENIPLFANTSGGFLEKLATLCNLVSYDANQTIITEDSSQDTIYFVLTGTCRCTRIVPFMKRLVKTSHKDGKQYDCRPCQMNAIPGEGEERINELLTMSQQLVAGDYFPAIESAQPFFEALYGINSAEKERPLVSAQASIITNTKVEVVTISIYEFVQLSGKRLLMKMEEETHPLKTDMESLQKAFMAKLRWNQYRNHILTSLKSSS